jgi:hypothetical protein
MNRIVANSSMWTQGYGAVQSSSRMMKGSDVVVVVMNESSVELDIESSAFVESRDLDVTVRLSPSTPIFPTQPTGSMSKQLRWFCVACVTSSFFGIRHGFCSYVSPSSP